LTISVDTKSNVASIVVPVVVGIILIIAILFTVWCIRRRKQQL